jgi:hypothetical protein
MLPCMVEAETFSDHPHMSWPLLCSFLLCFTFTCGIYHKTVLFRGHWFLLYFSHIPSPSTPYLISFNFLPFCYVFSHHFPIPLSCGFSLCTDPSNTLLCGLLVLIGSLIAPDPVSCFIYSYSTVMYPYMAFSFTLKMVAAGFSETLIPIWQTTLCHISEDYNPEFHHLKSLKLYMIGNISNCLCCAAVLSASVFLLTDLLYCWMSRSGNFLL